MPAYNFQKGFVPMILDGSKPHTIRPRRKNPTKPGDKLFLYTGQRTKKCKKIMETICTSVVPVQIMPVIGFVLLDSRRLSEKQIEIFAKQDGFKSKDEFFKFFTRYSRAILYFGLEVIHWGDIHSDPLGRYYEIRSGPSFAAEDTPPLRT